MFCADLPAIRFSPRDLLGGERLPFATSHNLHIAGDALCLTPKGESVETSTPKYVHAVSHPDGGRFVSADGTEIGLAGESGSYSVSLTQPYRDVFPLWGAKEQGKGFAVLCGSDAPDYVVLKFPDSSAHMAGRGYDAGCMHSDRLFLGAGRLVVYGVPGDPFTAPSQSEKPERSGGFVLRNAAKGDIVRMLSFGDRIALLRKYGVTLLAAYGDPYNFRTTEPYGAYEKILPLSAANTGDKIYFLTEAGLTCFDGEKTAPAGDVASRRIDLTKEVHGTAFAGKYYADVTLLDGGSCLYCYDPAAGAGHFFCKNGKAVYADDGLHFQVGTTHYRLGEQAGYPYLTDRSAWFDTGVFYPAGGRKFLAEGFRAEGEGTYECVATGDDRSFTLKAAKGEERSFPSALHTKSLTLRFTVQEGFSLRSLQIFGRIYE